jgi:tRNA 2-thiouridine synthesizing protein E
MEAAARQAGDVMGNGVQAINIAEAPGNSDRRCLDVRGRKVYLDGDGFLWDAQDWGEEVAEVMARESGLKVLSEIHWRALRFIREFYLDTGRAPRNRRVKEGTGLSLLELESLFPQGIKFGARRLAGLPASVKRMCD